MLTQKQVFEQLRADADANTEEGWSTAEYGKEMGLGRARAQECVRKGIQQGTIEPVGFRLSRNVNGARIRLPIYRFVNVVETKTADRGKKARPAPGTRAVPRRRNG